MGKAVGVLLVLFVALLAPADLGAVEAVDYESVRDEVKARFEATTDAAGELLGTLVFKPEEAHELRALVATKPKQLLQTGLQRRYSAMYQAARQMIDLGLPVVLATDFNPGSSPTASMPMVLSLASTQMRMPPAESITAATINAAYSLRRGDRIGSLEPGKLADLTVLDRDYFTIPDADIKKIRPVLTLLGGKVVHDSKVLKA